jgi:hypothetical protein
MLNSSLESLVKNETRMAGSFLPLWLCNKQIDNKNEHMYTNVRQDDSKKLYYICCLQSVY